MGQFLNLVGRMVSFYRMPFPYAKPAIAISLAVEIIWKGFGVDVPTYRRPLNVMVQSLLEIGFVIENIKASHPTEKVRELEPERYERILRNPPFLRLRARKIQD